jgi:hypothetical protein
MKYSPREKLLNFEVLIFGSLNGKHIHGRHLK